MQTEAPAATATGSFIKTPFPHLLVYALERRLTGTFEFSRGAATIATMLVVSGCPAKLRTEEPIHFLGEVMLELGMISNDQLQTSLARLRESPRLQGQILVEMAVVDQLSLEAALRAQVERKVEHLFGLPTETTFAYYDGVDLLQRYGGPPTPIDPFPVMWRGVRAAPAREHVDATLRRVGGALVRASAAAQFDRFAFAPPELEVVELLRHRPTRVVDITNIVGPSIGPALVYFLMIMKQVDLVNAASPSVAPPRTPNVPITPAGGQAFARVQLQRQRQTGRGALVVEEVVASSGAIDERASSPGMRAPTSAFASSPSPIGPVDPPTSAAILPPPIQSDAAITEPAPTGGLMDIGSMITQTIRSSLPPPIPAPASIPPESTASEPPTSASSKGLTAEQNLLKAKILERADQITSQDYFQMLGVEQGAPPEAVQKAFFALAKVWHPDRLPPALVAVKDACSKVFTHLTEAHATLMDPAKRNEYMTLLKDGGATPEDQAKIQAILEAATEFQKAEFLLKRSASDPQAYDLVKKAAALDSEQADYAATLAWLDAQRPEWLSREKTLEKIAVLDRCLQKNAKCERAFFYRGLLYKRIDERSKAVKDFKRAVELNPRNLDAMREVRLHNIRGGTTKPPLPGQKQQAPETLSGLFGKLFKK